MTLRISVITANYNCAATLADCLATVAAQSHADREHLAIDGGSTDGTLAILQAHTGQLGCVVSEPDRGIYDALNKGIARATGDVVGFMHADDLFASTNALQAVAEAFADPLVVAVYGDLEYVRQHDTSHVVRQWRSGAFSRRQLQWGWMPPHPTLYVRRHWYQAHGGFDTSYRISADYALILKLFSQPEQRFVHLPQVLVKMRIGGASNRSLRNIARKSAEDWRALRTSQVGALGGVGALVWKNLSKLVQFHKSMF